MQNMAIRPIVALLIVILFRVTTAFADTPAAKIIIQNKNLGLSTSRKRLNLQDALTRLHKPAASYFRKPAGISSLSGITWTGTQRVLCFSGGAFTVHELPTTVVFNPSTDTDGTVTASPSFAGVEGGADRCTTDPSGVSSGLYRIDGNNIAVQIGGTDGYSIWEISIIDGKMTVSQSNNQLSWILNKQ